MKVRDRGRVCVGWGGGRGYVMAPFETSFMEVLPSSHFKMCA